MNDDTKPVPDDRPEWHSTETGEIDEFGVALREVEQAMHEQSSSTDPTEAIRRQMIATGQPQQNLAADADRKWTTEEMQAEFEVTGFMAPYVVVRRRSDGVKGSLEFTHSPRVYFGWTEV